MDLLQLLHAAISSFEELDLLALSPDLAASIDQQEHDLIAIVGQQKYLNGLVAIFGQQKHLDDLVAILFQKERPDDLVAIVCQQEHLDDLVAIDIQ